MSQIIVVINLFFGLKWRNNGPKMRYFGLLENTHIFVYYPITSSKNIEVCRISGMFKCNYLHKYYGIYCTGLGTSVRIL